MGCGMYLKGYMKPDKPTPVIGNNNGNRKNRLVYYTTSSSIQCSQTELGKIEECLKGNGFLDVRCAKIETSGIREHWITGNYKNGKDTCGIFIRIPYEGSDKGKIHVSAAKDQIKKLLELESVLGIKLAEISS